MYDLDFADYSGSIGSHEESAQVVDDEFISTWMPSTIFLLAEKKEGHVPLGPKLVLTRFDSSETASIFRRTASSRPDICWNETHRQICKKRNIISYFVSIFEELDFIRLWDFQSHSASGSEAPQLCQNHGEACLPAKPARCSRRR
jgi:hypothetical protein